MMIKAHRYSNTPTPPPIGNYNVVDTSTGNTITRNRTEGDANTIAQAYNHFYCKPNKPDKYFVNLNS